MQSDSLLSSISRKIFIIMCDIGNENFEKTYLAEVAQIVIRFNCDSVP